MQTGTIVRINPRNGMFFVQIDGGDCTVFELMGGFDIAPGQRVKGDLDSSLCESIFNLDTAEAIEVYVQDTGCSPQKAWQCITA